MRDKTIFVVTVFEMNESLAKIDEERTPYFKYTFKDAEEVVLNNIGDIWETCYDYAVINEINNCFYPCLISRKFYKFNKLTNSYKPIDEPEYFKNTIFCGIG